MPTARIAVSVEQKVIRQMDRLVKEGKYKNRSSVIRDALEGKLNERKRKRLVEEVSRLDIREERGLADEFINPDSEEWDEY